MTARGTRADRDSGWGFGRRAAPAGRLGDAAYERRDDVLVDQGDWPPYSEHWGFGAAVEETFRLLGSLPKSAQLGKPLTYREVGEGYLGM